MVDHRSIELKFRGTIAQVQAALIANSKLDPTFENRVEEKTASTLVISTGGKHRDSCVRYEFKFEQEGKSTLVRFRVPLEDRVSPDRYDMWRRQLQDWIDSNQHQVAA